MDEVVARLRASGSVFAEEEAALLVAEASDEGELERLVADRVSGLPLEQVLGWAEFCGLRIRVAPGVFVPRRRSELLVQLALPHLHGGALVVDLCCGSGAIGAALAAAEPTLVVVAADLDPAAVACAGENLPSERVFEGDLYAALPRELRGRVEVIVANAPYVPGDEIVLMPPEAREHEPRSALDGGVDGLRIVRRVVAEAPLWLAPGGVVIVEVSRRQAGAAAGLLEEVGLDGRVEADDELAATAIVGVRHR